MICKHPLQLWGLYFHFDTVFWQTEVLSLVQFDSSMRLNSSIFSFIILLFLSYFSNSHILWSSIDKLLCYILKFLLFISHMSILHPRLIIRSTVTLWFNFPFLDGILIIWDTLFHSSSFLHSSALPIIY